MSPHFRVARRYWFCCGMVLWLALSGQVSHAQSPEAARTFRDYGQGDLTARTMWGSVSYYFPLPAHRVPVAGSALELVYSHSPLLEPSRSTMTVWVNGQPLESVWLTAENQDRARLTLPLPVDTPETPFTATGYFVEFRFYLRLTLDECEEFDNPAQWATIHGDSQLRLVTAPAPGPPDLAALDRFFTPLTGLDRLPTLALPQDPSAEELAAAGALAFQMGSWAASVGADALITVTHTLTAPVDETPTLVVAGQDRLAPGATWGELGWNGTTFLVDGARAGSGQGVLALATNPAPALLVSGDQAALTSAAQFVTDPARRALLTGEHVLLPGREPAPAASALPWRAGRADFDALGQREAQRVVGRGQHVLNFYHQRPPGWDLRTGSVLELSITTAPSLRAASSWVALTVNGMEVGSRPLQPGDGERLYRFELPDGALSQTSDGLPVRDLHAQVRLMLDFALPPCEAVDPDAAWATVTPKSEWRLHHTQVSALDLGRFPWPLWAGNDVGRPWPLIVAIADAPTAGEIQAGLQVMAALGRSGPGRADLPRLVTAGTVDEADRGHALIVLGSAPRNSLIAALNLTGAAVADSPPLAVTRIDQAEQTGTLHLLRSPWNRSRAVLAVTATDEAGLQTAAQGLASRATVMQLYGQVAALTKGPAAQVLVDVRPPPSFFARIGLVLLEGVSPWQVVAAALLVAVLAVLWILWRAYRRRVRVNA